MANPNLLQPSDLPAQLLKILIHGSGLTILRKDQQLQQARAWTGWWVLSDWWPLWPLSATKVVLQKTWRRKVGCKSHLILYLLLVLIRILKSNEIFLLGQEFDYLRSLITINSLMQRPNFQLHISSEILIWRLSYSIFQQYNYTIAHFLFICLSYLFNYDSVTWLWIVLILKFSVWKTSPRDPKSRLLSFVCACVF